MQDFSYVLGPTPAYIESLYGDFVKDSTTVDPEWRKFFEGFDFALAKTNGNGAAANTISAKDGAVNDSQLTKEFQVFSLIRAYCKRGHLVADTNPIRKRKDRKPKLALADFGLSDADLNTEFAAGTFIDMGKAKLGAIIDKLKKIYTGHVGAEFTYINDTEKCKWVKDAFEEMMQRELKIDQKKRILEKLNEGVIFEKFLNTKYIGQKRFRP